jgi:tRNA modification GTPase
MPDSNTAPPIETIAALSSPAGFARRCIVRISGPHALALAEHFFRSDNLKPREFPGFTWMDGTVLTENIPCRLYIMKAPLSYTREDVLEFHLPGNQNLAEMLLERFTEQSPSVRLARPGEFTRRALQNGRISLDQAQAVIAIIQAENRSELTAAARQLSGRIGRELQGWRLRLRDLIAAAEAELDYGEEAGSFLDPAQSIRTINELRRELLTHIDSSANTVGIDSGRVRLALAGAVNAGKSLLYSSLTGKRALVSPQKGTTRDVREAPLISAPSDISILDTAGLDHADGKLERLGQQAAEKCWRNADAIILLCDSSAALSSKAISPAIAAANQAGIPTILVLSKIDLPAVLDENLLNDLLRKCPPLATARLSSLTGEGLQDFMQLLPRMIHDGSIGRSPARALAGTQRAAVLREVLDCLDRAERAMVSGLGLACASDDLLCASRVIALHFEPQAGGSQLDDDVINRIFERFCVGK